MTDEYRVRLEAFEGPIDLLLYLIRRDEVDIHDIPVARITEQYIRHLDGIERIDIELAGEFLLMAATLMEIKSRVLAAPTTTRDEADSASGGDEDPRSDLVRQLLAYKRNRDLADALDQRLRTWEQRAPLASAACDHAQVRAMAAERAEFDLEDLTLADLVEAFQKIVESVNFAALGAHEVFHDTTPIELHAADLLDRVKREAPEGSIELHEVFKGRTRADMLGLFLAMLELVRQRRLTVRQEAASIVVALGLRAHEAEEEDPAESSSPSHAISAQDTL
ncbi:MAG: segregation/condensation protein A [Phycisphaeraceae bacterium]|nr:segregation/condensation protein A [Phycisphaeraceae bacterium]